MNRKRVGIVVFPDVEILDFCGPFEVFSVTRLDEFARHDQPSPFEVVIAEHDDSITATGGMKVIPDHTFDHYPSLDILVVPGGYGRRREIKNQRLLEWIGEQAKLVETIASVVDASRPGRPTRQSSRDHSLAVACVDA